MTFAPATNTTTNIADERAIQNVLDQFIAAWNAHDATMFASVFAEDVDFTNVKGVSRQGRAAFAAFHEPMFQTVWASSTQRISKVKIRFLKPDVAAVDAWWDLDGLKKQDGSNAPPRNGLLMLIMTKENEKWEITVMHNMDLPGSERQQC